MRGFGWYIVAVLRKCGFRDWFRRCWRYELLVEILSYRDSWFCDVWLMSHFPLFSIVVPLSDQAGLTYFVTEMTLWISLL